MRRALHSRPNNDNYSISQLRFGVTIWPSQKKKQKESCFYQTGRVNWT